MCVCGCVTVNMCGQLADCYLFEKVNIWEVVICQYLVLNLSGSILKYIKISSTSLDCVADANSCTFTNTVVICALKSWESSTQSVVYLTMMLSSKYEAALFSWTVEVREAELSWPDSNALTANLQIPVSVMTSYDLLMMFICNSVVTDSYALRQNNLQSVMYLKYKQHLIV